MWSGIPGWGRLLDNMADYVDRTGGDSAGIRKYSQPLLTADLAKRELTGEQYHGFKKSGMRVRTSKPGEIHQRLLDLGINYYIIINFDRLLERAIRSNGRCGRYYAHRTLYTLLATRDAIFVGFGLTDPDFLRIMDRFRNDYKQGAAEKYAIMPDVPAEEMNRFLRTGPCFSISP